MKNVSYVRSKLIDLYKEGKMTRTPSELVSHLQRQAESFNRVVKPESLRGLRGIVVSQLIEIFGDEDRHILLAAIFPETIGSTKNLTAAQCDALLRWLAYAETADERFGYGTGTRMATRATERAKGDGDALIKEYRISHGQIEFPLTRG